MFSCTFGSLLEFGHLTSNIIRRKVFLLICLGLKIAFSSASYDLSRQVELICSQISCTESYLILLLQLALRLMPSRVRRGLQSSGQLPMSVLDWLYRALAADSVPEKAGQMSISRTIVITMSRCQEHCVIDGDSINLVEESVHDCVRADPCDMVPLTNRTLCAISFANNEYCIEILVIGTTCRNTDPPYLFERVLLSSQCFGKGLID